MFAAAIMYMRTGTNLFLGRSTPLNATIIRDDTVLIPGMGIGSIPGRNSGSENGGLKKEKERNESDLIL